MDEDLSGMDRGQLEAEVRKLRDGIRADSQSTGHDLCWHRPELWSLVPGYVKPEPEVPRREEFIRHCELYRDSFDPPLPNGPRLESVFGMAEMESAASRMIEKRERLDIPLLCKVTVTWDTMRGRFEQHGLLNLLRHGWLDPNMWNFSAHGEFFPSESMVRRIEEKLGRQPWLEWVPQGDVERGPDLSSVFGMWEMEAAAQRMIGKMKAAGAELLCRVPVSMDDMDGELERNGFLQLIHYGWLEPSLLSKKNFFASGPMLERVERKLGPHPWLKWAPQEMPLPHAPPGTIGDGEEAKES